MARLPTTLVKKRAALAYELDAALRVRVNEAAAVVSVVLDAARKLRHTESLNQIYALALHGTIIELFSACVGLANWGEPTDRCWAIWLGLLVFASASPSSV